MYSVRLIYIYIIYKVDCSFVEWPGRWDHIVPTLFLQGVSRFLVNILSFRIFRFAKIVPNVLYVPVGCIDFLPRNVDILIRLVGAVVDHIKWVVGDGLVGEVLHRRGEGVAIDVHGVVLLAGPVSQVCPHDSQTPSGQ